MSQRVIRTLHTVNPTPFSKKHFEHAVNLQPLFNKLSYVLGKQKDILFEMLEGIDDPEFTNPYIQMAVECPDPSGFTFNLLRSDYMVDEPDNVLLQVELNMISCAYVGVSSLLCEMNVNNEVPSSPALECFKECMQLADTLWRTKHNIKDDTVIAFITNQDERQSNQDLHLLSAQLENAVLATASELELDDESGHLVYTGNDDMRKIVSVAYFRHFYDPEHFDQGTWKWRSRVEQSLAIKVPNAIGFLIGTKRVQQGLVDMDAFLTSHDLIDVKACFAEQCSLADPRAMELIKTGSFVLKPQREGGGHNVFGLDIVEFVSRLSEKEYPMYTLQRLIKPPVVENVRIIDQTGCEQTIEKVVQELGIYGMILADNQLDQILYNKAIGHVLRSKEASRNEGCVTKGYGFLDCPRLV